MVISNSISARKIWWILLYLMLILFNVQKSTGITKLAVIFFVVISLAIIKTNVRIPYQICAFAVFIVWNLALVFSGNVYDRDHSLFYIKTIAVNLVLYILIYNVLLKENKIHKILKCFIITTVISAIIIVLGNWGSITSGRLSFSWREENMFQLLGVAFYPIGSNGLAMICCISIAFSAYFIAQKSKNTSAYLLADLFLLIIILLTGSRKGILLFSLVLFIIAYCFYTGTKRFKNSLLVIILMLVIFYSIKTIPVLYNIVGERSFELLNVILSNKTTDTSYLTRSTLIEHAIIYFESRPMIGYGLDSFRIMSGSGICIDNNYLEILVSSGIVGFLIYYSYIPITIYQCRKLKNKTPILRAMILIMISLLLIHMGSVTYYSRSEWTFLMILFSQIKIEYYLSKTVKKENRETEHSPKRQIKSQF